MEEEIKQVVSILEEIADLNTMIRTNKENRYLHDQFLNNKAGYVQELNQVLAKFDMGIEVKTNDLP